MDKIDTLKNKINDLNNELVTIEMHQKKIDRENLIKHMIKIRDFEFSKPENIQMFIDSCIDYIFLFKNKKIAVLFKLSDGNIQRECSRNVSLVELKRIELSTSWMQIRRSPRWATAPINGRENRIRTCDPLVPSEVHYQAVLLPDGALSKNRTRNLQIRSLTLYPVEL